MMLKDWLKLTLLLLDHYKSDNNIDLPNISYDSAYTLMVLYYDDKTAPWEEQEVAAHCQSVLSYVYGKLDCQIKSCPTVGKWWKNTTHEQAVKSYKHVLQYQQ